MTTLKKDIVQDLTETTSTEINNQLSKLTQLNSETKEFPTLQQMYASKVSQAPPPKPTIIISPKDLKLPVHKLRNRAKQLQYSSTIDNYLLRHKRWKARRPVCGRPG